MKQTFVLTDSDGNEREISEKRHPGWEKLGDPCPDCGTTEYRHFTAEGSRYGLKENAVVRRSDYWETDRSLMTQCLSCKLELYRHPAFNLLYETSEE